MMTGSLRRLAVALAVALAAAGPARAQFLDPFDGPSTQVGGREPRLAFDVED
jgi:hypothetical protein